MFEELLGLPAHPLLVHAAVVFVPLLAIAAVAYAVAPLVRRWIAWAVVGLAAVAPLAAWFATESGEALRERLIGQGLRGEALAPIDRHQEFGDRTLWATIGLGVLAVLLVWLFAKRGGRPPVGGGRSALVLNVVLAVGVIILAGASAYYVYKTGDSGARLVWGES